MARSATSRVAIEREKAREKKRRELEKITLDGVNIADRKDSKSAEYQREYYARNHEKAKAAARERMRAYRARNRDKLTMRRQKHQLMAARIRHAARELAGWRWREAWRQDGREFEFYTPFMSAADWYERWFASLDNPELYPW